MTFGFCGFIFHSSLEGGGDVGSFRFNGNGYASVPQIKRYNNKRYNIALTFRTYDENALLFLCANDKDPMVSPQITRAYRGKSSQSIPGSLVHFS